jgi:hypothetical protein
MTDYLISDYLPKNLEANYHFLNPVDDSDNYVINYSFKDKILHCNLYKLGLLSVSQKIEINDLGAEIISTRFYETDGNYFDSFHRSILIPSANSLDQFQVEILETGDMKVIKIDSINLIKRCEVYKKGLWLYEIHSSSNPNYADFTMRLERIVPEQI